MTARRVALVMAGAFAVYAVLVAWRGWDFIMTGEPVAIGLGLAVLLLPLLAGWLVWREVSFGFQMQELGERIEMVDERSMEERIAAAQADPNDWQAWYWAGVSLLEAGDKKQARAALEHAWDVRNG
jgi:cytochrome c-type biogenesis protein CcmH/NrfG